MAARWLASWKPGWFHWLRRVAAAAAVVGVATEMTAAARLMEAAKPELAQLAMQEMTAMMATQAGSAMEPPAAKVMAKHLLLRTLLRQTRRLRPRAWPGISARLRMQRRQERQLRLLLALLARRRAILLARACRLAKLLGGAALEPLGPVLKGFLVLRMGLMGQMGQMVLIQAWLV